MEALVLIKEVGAYSERQYQRQDGTTEYFKSRGVVLKHGGDEVYGELTGEYASKQRDTQFFENQLSSATRSSSRTSLTWPRASGSIAHGRIRTARRDMRMHCTSLICRPCKVNSEK